ncbi:MAG: dihydrolipoyl dehydrogenase [Nitrospinaceae bacterium]|nr:dihydrolipoyl dehydrogenase [Nitrospinaceae bacterium]NIR57871.1 dihydrolipoyl dehydrogenase [Nitrospinaceae bacterium]NIS88330.1 dihydrolipoyl dehydrogenase [Nitrospinaceae bacterium]NIT85208.1 dihydrolipoyl dehydrogenase [Nitrospinaceae bacterium]NIU47358.1 dihydrolipoyl dehydrogenase [Nitrospinaceae bacterium]
MTDKSLLIVGGGPGGYAAAFLASDLGMKVTLIDEEKQLGGVCLLRGCIPSKALLHLAKLISEVKDAAQWGLSYGSPEIDLDKIRDWKSRVTGNLTGGLAQLCKQRGIERIAGRAVFKSSQSVEVAGHGSITFERAVIAVGSTPVFPADWAVAGVMDSTRALELENIPQRLLVIGGGYIGLEMGTVYAALGSRVSVVEMTDGILPGVDRDLVRILQARLRKTFDRVDLNTRVVSLQRNGASLKVVLQKGEEPEETQEFDGALAAVGRQPNTRDLGLENTRVQLDDRGFVKVDADGQTDDSAIYAVGDVIGGAMLAHKASHEGKKVVEKLAGGTEEPMHPVVPAVVFTDPEIAWCGLTESEARAQGTEIAIAKFPWGASGRASTLGRNDGTTKLIVDPHSRRILGVGLVGSGVGELISEAALAIQMKARVEDLAGTIHPHPTLSETLMEAAEVFLGKSTHQYKKTR